MPHAAGTTATIDAAAPPARVPAPCWAVWIAHAIPLCVLPSGLWRIAMALGVPVGYTAAELRDLFDVPGWGAVYVIGLSVALEGLALLSLGLVRPWGETVPHRVPLVGGRQIPTAAVVAIAGTGALVLTLLAAGQLVVWPQTDHDRLPLMGPTYAPLLAWGPLLGMLVIAYARRRRRARRLVAEASAA